MPLYDFLCHSCSHSWEEFYATWREAPPSLACACGAQADRLVGLPGRMGGERAVMTGEEFWRGTALDGSDGVNPYLPKGHIGHWEPKKSTVDLAQGVRK